MRAVLTAPLVLVPLLATAPAAAQAPAAQAHVQRIQESLVRGDAAPLSVQWDVGAEGGERQRLVIQGGAARLARCPPGGCADVAPPTPLTAGQRERLLSGLRALGLGTLRSAGANDPAPDRALTLTLPGLPPARFRLARSEWPAPAGGDAAGLAAFLDELTTNLARAQAARRPLPVPTSVADLQAVRLKLHLRPRERPGGTLVLERGVARVTPEEGTRPRTPRPAPFERRLGEAELQRIVAALQAAQLDRLEDAVPRRAAPAVDDDDGRLATLHLLPLLDTPGALEGQPRGWERFLVDLMRSPARPLLDELLALLLAAAPAPPPRSLRDVIGRDDLVLSWTGRGAEVTVRLGDLQAAPREELRRALVVAGPSLPPLSGGRGERVLRLSAPAGTRDHLVGTYAGPLRAWQRGHTARLADLLEERLQSKKPESVPQ